MRGEIDTQRGMFSYIDLEQRVPQDHPIRKIRRVVDKALIARSARTIRTNQPQIRMHGYSARAWDRVPSFALGDKS